MGNLATFQDTVTTNVRETRKANLVYRIQFRQHNNFRGMHWLIVVAIVQLFDHPWLRIKDHQQRSMISALNQNKGQIMIVSAIVTNKLVGEIDFILEMDVIRRVGGVTISSSGITFLSSKLDGRVSLQNQNKTNEKVVMNEGKAQDNHTKQV
ncbi:hypothetical protein GJ496_006902 [Pomphorhynchus laevis]|nr:hypothetical protein GJ496_006902 [Pomphorhynchus laevis]